jgi:hypothetical protein
MLEEKEIHSWFPSSISSLVLLSFFPLRTAEEKSQTEMSIEDEGLFRKQAAVKVLFS